MESGKSALEKSVLVDFHPRVARTALQWHSIIDIPQDM
jgi:hypothetical protein